jgi:hypothetical protein
MSKSTLSANPATALPGMLAITALHARLATTLMAVSVTHIGVLPMMLICCAPLAMMGLRWPRTSHAFELTAPSTQKINAYSASEDSSMIVGL